MMLEKLPRWLLAYYISVVVQAVTATVADCDWHAQGEATEYTQVDVRH